MTWDRSNQRYWILRRGKTWSVRRMSSDGGDGGHVCDWPAHWDDEVLSKSLCFAASDEVARKIAKTAFVARHIYLIEEPWAWACLMGPDGKIPEVL